MDENKPQSGWLVKSFWKSWSWLVSVVGFVLAIGPDMANLALASLGTIATVFPEMSLRQKAIILLTANVLTILLRPVKQKNMPADVVTIPVVTVRVPDTVAMGPAAIPVATEVEHHERIRGDPGSSS